MNIVLFALSMILGVLGPVLALSYLRPILRKVLLGLCDAEGGADFWLRSAYALATCGTLLLLLTFGRFDAGIDVVHSLRATLWLVMAGVFGTIAFVVHNVWSQVQPAGERAAAPRRQPAADERPFLEGGPS